MSESNKHVLQQANAAVLAGDNEGFLAFCSDDIKWTKVGGQTIHGKDALRAWMKAEYTQPPRFTVHHMIAEDDHVVAVGDIVARDAAGKPATHAYCDVWRFSAGKMVELKAYVIEVEAL